MIIQRSITKCLNNEDVNSKYFHAIISKSLRQNHIGPISTLRGIVSSVKDVKGEVFNHFVHKFKEDDMNRPKVEGDLFKKLNLEDRQTLELPFEEVEIKEVIWNCDGTKSLGPDGFSFKFIKRC